MQNETPPFSPDYFVRFVGAPFLEDSQSVDSAAVGGGPAAMTPAAAPPPQLGRPLKAFPDIMRRVFADPSPGLCQAPFWAVPPPLRGGICVGEFFFQGGGLPTPHRGNCTEPCPSYKVGTLHCTPRIPGHHLNFSFQPASPFLSPYPVCLWEFHYSWQLAITVPPKTSSMRSTPPGLLHHICIL